MEQTVSIIVPVYNAAKTLARCVDSLTGQTYENLEILLVNDGSRDDSLSLCREYAASDSRIRVIDKPNGGVSSARNAGLDAARGDFVLFCDSDDWVEPDLCESMLEQYRPGDTVICEGDWMEKTETGPRLVEDAERKDILHYPKFASSPCNKLFLRSTIGTLRFHEELRMGEDFCFCMEYLCRADGKIRLLHRCLYHYDTGTSGSLGKQAPTPEQCEAFYRYLQSAMETLGALDAVSIGTRNDHINWHFDTLLMETAERTDLTRKQKFACADRIAGLESFRKCCADLREDRNPVYLWAYRGGHTRLAMCFLLLRKTIKQHLPH